MESPADLVARRVRDLREKRGASVRDLSRWLGEIGRPMLPSVVSKLERGERRVDVNDLLALSYVLDVPPVCLLIDTEAATTPIAPGVTMPSYDALLWATGLRWPGDGHVPGTWVDASLPVRRARAVDEALVEVGNFANWVRSPATARTGEVEKGYRDVLVSFSLVLGALSELGMSLPEIDPRVIADAQRLGVDLPPGGDHG